MEIRLTESESDHLEAVEEIAQAMSRSAEERRTQAEQLAQAAATMEARANQRLAGCLTKIARARGLEEGFPPRASFRWDGKTAVFSWPAEDPAHESGSVKDDTDEE